ncbi:MAG: hypothetical protein ACLGH8_01650 [Bacteroidia bacterium]
MNDITTFGAIGAAFAIGLLASFIARKISAHKKQLMLKKYSELRKQSLAMQGTMNNLIMAGDAERKTIDGTLTCADFYKQLKSNHMYNLSDKYLSKVKKSNNLLFLNKAERNLYEQEAKLKNAQQLLSFAMAL